MDSVNSSNDFASQRLANAYLNAPQTASRSAKTSSHVNPLHVNAVSKTAETEPFSNLFDDKDLERLQNNLESVAQLAETALKRFSDKR